MNHSKTHRGTPIGLGAFHGKVDVIISFHGQYQRVTSLLESILRFTFSNPIQICLVDDCSPNADYLGYFLSTIPALKCIRTPTRLGFGGAMQVGYQATNSKWCLFLHSDCLVEDVGWLKNLGECLVGHAGQKVEMVSPLTDNAVSGDPRQKGVKGNGGKDIILDLDQDPDAYLAMHCFMVRRDLFKRVGGFIKNYPFGWYEDMEFAYRLKKHGLRQAIAGNAWVRHEGYVTVKHTWRRTPASRKIMEEENYQRCCNDIGG